MTADEALIKLADSTADAVASVLQQFVPAGIERGRPSVGSREADPLAGVVTPAVAASVSYVNGVTGGNVFVVTRMAARRLAAAMMGAEPEDDEDGELSELELSAVSEAMNQMMAAAAGATGKVLGEEVEIGAPDSILLDDGTPTGDLFERAAHVVSVPFTILREPCRLVQLVPNAFVVRMSRALDEQEGELLGDRGAGSEAFGGEMLRDVKLRLWAELGRARLPVGRAVGLARGSVLELDRRPDDPVDIFVNGRLLALGRLLLTEDGDWAVRVESISPDAALSRNVQEGVT